MDISLEDRELRYAQFDAALKRKLGQYYNAECIASLLDLHSLRPSYDALIDKTEIEFIALTITKSRFIQVVSPNSSQDLRELVTRDYVVRRTGEVHVRKYVTLDPNIFV